MVRLTDRPDMAIDVYNGRKTTTHTALHLQCLTVSEYPSTRSVVQDALAKIQTSLCICSREKNRQLYNIYEITSIVDSDSEDCDQTARMQRFSRSCYCT